MSEVFPVTDDPRFRKYLASAGQTAFTVPFPWQDNGDIAIWRSPLTGDPFVLQEGQHYELTGAGETAGGSFVLLEGFEALEGETFLVLGDALLQRVTSVAQGGRFRFASTDNEFDRLVLIAQEIYRELGRSLRVDYGVLQPEVTPGENNMLVRWLNGNMVPGPIWGEELGITGPGVPAGGTTGQTVRKASNADYDMEWGNASGDVVGPAGATDSHLALFDGDSGLRLKDGATTIASMLSRASHTGTQLLATISDAGTAASKNTGTSSGNVPVLNGSGKLDNSVIPAVALVDIYTVASQAAMLALSSAEQGDVAIRTDLNKCFVLSTNSPSTLADWKELLTPTDAVLSVAGLTGAISAPGLKTALAIAQADVSGLTTASNPQFAGIELGHASDTSITRPAAGRISVEGNPVLLGNTEQQTVAGGANVTVKDLGNLSGASITPNPGNRPIQKITNNGAGSVLPGSNEGQYTLEVINTTGAGAITTTGWTLKGDSFDTTTTSKFVCSCIVTSDVKLMTIVKVA